MNQHLSSLLLGLLFVAATACSEKKDPEPAPSLEGTWMQTRLTQHIPCSNCTTQGFLQDVTYATGAQTVTITPKEYIVRNTAQGTVYTFSYIRSSDTLVVTMPLAGNHNPVTYRTSITELKARSLHLQQRVRSFSGRTAIIDEYFTR